MRSMSLGTCATVAGLVLFAGRAFSDEPKPDAYQPAARELLEEVAKTYQDMKSYSDEGVLRGVAILAQRQGTGTRMAQAQRNVKRSVHFARPNKLHIRIDNVEVYCDGKNVTTVIPPLKRYAVAPAPKHIDVQSLIKVPGPGVPAGIVFGGDGGLSIAVVFDLLASDDPVKSTLEATDGLKLEADRFIRARRMKSLLVDQSEGPDIRMLVDPRSKLVEAIELVYDVKDLNSDRHGETRVQQVSLIWRAGEIGTEVPDDAFVFKPPSDFKKVDPSMPEEGDREKTGFADEPAAGASKSGDQSKEEEQSLGAIEKLLNKPAPDFSFTQFLSGGQTRAVTKADLAGKVVLLDFWATWCGPCLKELPEMQKLAEALAPHAGKVALVALSEDADPSDVDGLRSLVEKTLTEKKVKLGNGPASMLAVDLEGKAADQFKVENLPTLLLLDAKGIVRAAHVGYTENAAEVFRREIEAVLAGKPVPAAHPKSQTPAGK